MKWGRLNLTIPKDGEFKHHRLWNYKRRIFYWVNGRFSVGRVLKQPDPTIWHYWKMKRNWHKNGYKGSPPIL